MQLIFEMLHNATYLGEKSFFFLQIVIAGGIGVIARRKKPKCLVMYI